jgi:hypothetical protein
MAAALKRGVTETPPLNTHLKKQGGKIMIKKGLTLALAAAALFTSLGLAATAARAGELTLFSQENFNGREVTLRDFTPDLVQLGFNDRASSMVVRSGRWEICADAGFRGDCAVFEPGEYPRLDRFNDRISSAREVGREGRDGRDGGRPGWERGPRGMAELFSRPGLYGNSTRIVRDTDDFVQIGFNDRTVSVRIDDGTWEFCSDAGFRGQCRVFGPGEYPDLGPGLTGRVSSARLVPPDRRGPDEGRGGYPGRPDGGPDGRPDGRPGPGPEGDAPVLLFQDDGLRGRPLPLRGDAPDLVPFGFNDQASSLVIRAGSWQFCVDSHYRGQCRILGPGEYRRLDPVLFRSISSARRVR